MLFVEGSKSGRGNGRGRKSIRRIRQRRKRRMGEGRRLVGVVNGIIISRKKSRVAIDKQRRRRRRRRTSRMIDLFAPKAMRGRRRFDEKWIA